MGSRWGLIVVLGLSGCYLSHGRGGPNPPDAGPDAGIEAGRPVPVDPHDTGPEDTSVEDPEDAGGGDAGPPEQITCDAPVGVDLLLVIDDSGSFRPEDALLRDRLSRLLRRLVRPLDLDRDGFEDWPRVQDLHVGIVSTSVAGPEFCSTVADGALRRGAGASFEECTRAPYPAYQTFSGGDDPTQLVDDAMCVAFGPREGCQVEQPLEAMAKALLPRGAPFSFIAGEARGNTENAGFLRPDSALAVVVFTDEDDCSFYDPTIFDAPDAGPFFPGLDAGGVGITGCRGATEGLYDVERYVDVLRHVRPAHPERVVFGFVGGIEPAFTSSFGRHLGTCGGIDYPRRLVDFASQLDGRAVAGSSCRLSETTFVQEVARRVAGVACEDP